MAEKKSKCPYCGSRSLGQPAENYAGRTISKTVGYAVGATLASAGYLFSLGTVGNKISRFMATNVVEPIGDIVPRRYVCKSCGREFE